MNELHWTLFAVGLACSLLVIRHMRTGYLRQRLLRLQEELQDGVARYYLVQPCSRCQESHMRFLECSPHARSVHYECLHCGKKNHSPAGTPDAVGLPDLWATYQELLQRVQEDPEEWMIEFDTPDAALPYEQTTRSPIPEAVRSEVWRRDQGSCVTCGRRENLQFDHIIPLARGGATSVQNLQILCGQCNAAKGDRI